MPADLADRTADATPAPIDETEALEAGLDVLDAPTRTTGPRARRVLARVAPPVIAAAVLLLAWQVLVSSGLKPSYALPSPSAVWASLVEQLQSNAAQRSIVGSLRRAAVGFTISIILGTLLGIVLSRFRLIRRGIGPLVTGMQSLPSVAWVPAAILWFGLTDAAVYAVVLLGSVPSIANGLLAGIDHAPPSYRRVARVLGAGTLAELRWVTLPAALPAYLAGLRQGWAFAWRSLMAAELIAYSPQLGPGLGQLLDTGRELSDMPLVLASILLILFVGIGVEALIFGPVERRLVRTRGLAGG
ncbi:MAG: ABC transporter permease [Actinomycetales bacterium]|uniref:ABC transporter permease n=1 Tax=Candidatus Phosphoribacter hodrii TaxID=2953743 RepID=A0A935M9B4_9MICO|nr:ABC transporter permease [Candidatus Phosphoribacter hodrii]